MHHGFNAALGSRTRALLTCELMTRTAAEVHGAAGVAAHRQYIAGSVQYIAFQGSTSRFRAVHRGSGQRRA